MNIVILLGAPGSGKGTVAGRMHESADGIAHLSTGDLLRGAVKAGTPAGVEAKAYMTKGELVPDTIIAQMVADYIAENASLQTVLLDGFPRNVAQADMLSDLLTSKGITLKCALMLEVSDATVINRISGRRVCPTCGAGFNVNILPPKVDGICDACGAELITRADDCPETVANRLNVYREQTFPLIAYYRDRNLLRSIDGEHDDLDRKVADALKAIQ